MGELLEADGPAAQCFAFTAFLAEDWHLLGLLLLSLWRLCKMQLGHFVAPKYVGSDRIIPGLLDIE